MAHQLAFNASAMRSSAASTRSALAGSGTAFTRVGDCGSPLVAETVAFFLEKLEAALKDGEKKSEALAQNIELTADDFAAIEDEHGRQIQALVDALEGLY